MAASKVTFDDKQHILPYGTHETQIWDTDINEIKNANNTNADIIDLHTTEIEGLTAAQTGGLKSFTTLALLQAYATPNVNDSYKVTNDTTTSNNGYYHWVSGTTYVKDYDLANGLVESGNVDAVSGGEVYNVTSKKVDFVVGKNLFDKTSSGIINNTYINPSGNYISSVSYLVTDWIPISPNTNYIANGGDVWYSVFDAQKNYLRGGSVAAMNSGTNAAYGRFTVIKTRIDTYQLEQGTVSTTYEAYEKYTSLPPLKGSVKNSSLSSDFSFILNNKSVSKEKLIDSKLLFVSGTVAQSIGATNEDSSSASYAGWGNRFYLASDTIVNSIKVNTTYINQDFTLNIYKANTLIFTQRILISEVIDGVILFPQTTFLAATNYDVMLDFDANKGTTFSNTAVTGISTALYRTGGNVAVYPKSAVTLFQLTRYGSLVYNTNLTLKSTDISDFNTQVTNLISGNLNSFELPSTLYAYKSVRNDFNYENALKYLDRQNNYLRFSGTGVVSYNDKAKVTPTSNLTITANLYDEEFSIIKTKTISLIVKDFATMTTAKNIVCIGDSLTEGGRFIDKSKQLLTTKANFNGIIQSLQGDATNFSEGRSGWTLANFFAMSKSSTGYHSPFMHPSGKKYYGVVEKNANELLLTGRGGMSAKLNEIGFNSNGYPTTPTTTSVVYSIANARYEIWNGSSWVNASLTDSDFVFNFATYRSAWNIPTTDILYIMLGTNDFRNVEPSNVATNFTAYKLLLDQVIASAKEDNASIKIGIGIANTYTGSNDNNVGYFDRKLTRSMYECRKLKIANYDNRTAESIYVVDWGLSFNTKNGFDKVTETPFVDYNGSELVSLDSNTPHPGVTNNGYYPMGQTVAAFIANF